MTEISEDDLECNGKVKFIYSGNNEFPFDAREQWTDSCNLLALKEGVVLGYDRNDKTVEAFKDNGFQIIHAQELIERLEKGDIRADHMKNTLILMPSAELSRARGGFHCMSMPLLRDDYIINNMQTTSHVLMIRPVNFIFNAETAVNNGFQVKG